MSRCTLDPAVRSGFRVRGFHPLWLAFPKPFCYPSKSRLWSEPHGARTMVWALPVSLAATSGIDVSFFSSGYLDVSVHRVPFRTLWIGVRILEVCSSGFPHSEICGSVDICSSPQLFAAYHVFHRLLVPRHPPCALLCFTNIPCIALHVCLAFELLVCCFFSDVLLTDLEFTPHPCTREQVRSFADIRRISAPCLSSTVIGMQAFLRLCLPARPVNSSHYFLG